MLNKVEGNELFDIYGDLLTKRQQEVLLLYYQEDFSYFEIAENFDISRSAVQDMVSRATNLLEKYELVIGYNRKRKDIMALLDAGDYDAIKKIL